jgi:hypothetical protein
MVKIRYNEDIKYIIVQHTEHVVPVSAEIVNNEHLQIGDFGAPYDILIDKYGNISLTPRWIRSQKSNFLENSVSPSKIFKYKEHFYSDVQPIFYQNNCLNIGVIGNFDIERPNSLIFSSLIKIFEEIYYNLGLAFQTSLLYYSEINNTTSPGVFFYSKCYLISHMNKAIIPRATLLAGSGIVPPITDNNNYRLLESGGIRLLESSGRRLLEVNT